MIIIKFDNVDMKILATLSRSGKKMTTTQMAKSIYGNGDRQKIRNKDNLIRRRLKNLDQFIDKETIGSTTGYEVKDERVFYGNAFLELYDYSTEMKEPSAQTVLNGMLLLVTEEGNVVLRSVQPSEEEKEEDENEKEEIDTDLKTPWD